jgi:uncharacterized membrane protein YdbT with pleckstrin-like domain
VVVRRHPIVLLRHAVELCLGLYVLLWLRRHVPGAGAVRSLVGLAIVALVVRTVWKLARWNVDRFIVTDARVLLVSGLANRRVSMLPLRKLTDMSYRRTSLGWMLGYGEFVMESAGEAQALHRVRFLPHPDRLYLQLSELLFPADAAIAMHDY